MDRIDIQLYKQLTRFDKMIHDKKNVDREYFNNFCFFLLKGMMQGPNGQAMNGPQMNMPMGAPNMMPGKAISNFR